MQKGKTLSTMGRFAPYMSRYKGVVALDLFCAALTTLCELTLPMIMRTLTNAATQDAVAFSMTLVAKMGLIYFVLRMIDCVAAYVMANMGHVMGAKIETDMRRDAFEHLQKLSDSYFANTKVGQIMGRITNDLFDVTEFAHHCPEEFFIALLKGTVSFIILANINLWLTIIIFCFIPIMYFCCMRFNKRVKEAFRKQRRHIGELNARLEDSLLGERVVKAFGGEEQECEKFEKDNSRFLDIKKESYKYMSLFQTTTRFFDGVMYIVVIVAGGWFLSKRLISSGDLVAYLLYVSTLLVTIRRIIEFAEQFQRGITGIERFCEIMDADVDILDEDGAKPLNAVKGAIKFDDVSFEYPDDHNRVLHHLTLEIHAGEKLALVGPSGGGKTTLTNLIPRFYDATSGQILIDGQDVRGVTLKSLRGAIGIVQQDVYLFSGSVYDNIAYARPEASEEEVHAAAKLAGAHEF
ncbi:MAG: ABC transporter ATP-binding protein, partial [Oscillospiraceae bacterium]